MDVHLDMCSLCGEWIGDQTACRETTSEDCAELRRRQWGLTTGRGDRNGHSGRGTKYREQNWEHLVWCCRLRTVHTKLIETSGSVAEQVLEVIWLRVLT